MCRRSSRVSLVKSQQTDTKQQHQSINQSRQHATPLPTHSLSRCSRQRFSGQARAVVQTLRSASSRVASCGGRVSSAGTQCDCLWWRECCLVRNRHPEHDATRSRLLAGTARVAGMMRGSTPTLGSRMGDLNGKGGAGAGAGGAEPHELDSSFFVMVTGQIESGYFGEHDSLYCKHAFTYGADWTVLSGSESGLSQIARKAPTADFDGVVWNFPLDTAFKSTNVFGWPRIALAVFGVDALGRDVVRGYGSLLIPTAAGQYEREVHMYVPVASSLANQWWAWLTGSPPEFFDPTFVNQAEGREVTRVRSAGSIQVKINVNTKGMAAFGYTVPGDTEAGMPEAPVPGVGDAPAT